ncbi:mucin-2-like isoform X2 [Phlebotomus papatasi]|uniref:Chitin-binding type-2 domain-containing protein n=1 Tax=Phlebotomus papatasi TaxID=29031 RepID=A0A1B0EYH3_PHLPP|nr:mucin-2-like isoform X2 [Phlebotomus papatasi]
MKRLACWLLVCLGSVATVLGSDDIVCPEGRWMVTLPHEDCHQFHLCIFGRAVELKCPFGLYWDPIEGGCGRSVDVSCVKDIAARQEPPQPPIETTSFPPQPTIETTTPEEETETTDETETPGETDETPEETTVSEESPTPPFSTTGNTPTPPFSTTGATPTPPVSTTGAQPTPPVSTTPDGSETGTPPEVTTESTEETTTGVETGTPPEVTTSEPGTTGAETTTTTTTTTVVPTTTTGIPTGTPPEVTTSTGGTATPPEVTTPGVTQPPTTPGPPTCPPDGIHYFPDPQACNRFFLCQNGQLIHMMCAPGQIFDQTYLRCRHDGVCQLFGWLQD